LENLTLGFENFTAANYIDVCAPDWSIWSGCVYNILNAQEADLPTGWVIQWGTTTRQDYFLQMTNEWSTEGSRSLRMWVITPGDGEPNSAATACKNISFNRYPSIYKQINDTFLLSYNVTFPAENMLLSYDVVACSRQVLKHSGIEDFNPFSNASLCPKKCYANSCDTIPKSDYTFNINEAGTVNSVLGAPQTLKAEQLGRTVSFPIEGVSVGVDYNIVFALVPESRLDASGQCVMIDNVRYEVIAEPLTDTICGEGCTSGCDPEEGSQKYFQCRSLPNGECYATIINNYASCIDSQEVREAVENLDPYCDEADNTKRWFYNEQTRMYEQDTCLEGSECVDGYCIDSGQAEIDRGEIGVDETIEAMATVPWAFSLIILLLTIVVAIFTRESIVALFGFGQFIFVSSLMGILSIYFAIGEIVICVGIIAYYISKPAQNSGGG
jgi:hypothetical protein